MTHKGGHIRKRDRSQDPEKEDQDHGQKANSKREAAAADVGAWLAGVSFARVPDGDDGCFKAPGIRRPS